MAVASASLSTSILSISEGLMALKGLTFALGIIMEEILLLDIEFEA